MAEGFAGLRQAVASDIPSRPPPLRANPSTFSEPWSGSLLVGTAHFWKFKREKRIHTGEIWTIKGYAEVETGLAQGFQTQFEIADFECMRTHRNLVQKQCIRSSDVQTFILTCRVAKIKVLPDKGVTSNCDSIQDMPILPVLRFSAILKEIEKQAVRDTRRRRTREVGGSTRGRSRFTVPQTGMRRGGFHHETIFRSLEGQ